MALFDDIPVVGEVLSGGNLVTGVAIGVGAVMILPLAASVLRPLAKTAINGGMLAYQSVTGLLEASVISLPRLPPRAEGRLLSGQWKGRRPPPGWRDGGAVEVRTEAGLRGNPGNPTLSTATRAPSRVSATS
jgi:hypothetical protein